MSLQLFRNARIVDGTSQERPEPIDFAVENGRFVEVGPGLKLTAETDVDLGGMTVMPGLIDCHVHVSMVSGDLKLSANLPSSWVAIKSAEMMRAMLMRGFCTVRDMGGADWGIRQAVRDGLIDAPRLVICGKALSQSGGHTDYREPYLHGSVEYYRQNLGAMGRVVDGVNDVRRAAREEIRCGAEFIKVMADGGVSSPADPIGYLVFSVDELKAVVEVAKGFGSYVSGHLYADEAINRALDCGFECIEHGNLASDETIKRIAALGARVVPTNITHEMVSKMGVKAGMSPDAIERGEIIREAGLERTVKYHEAGVITGYGSDLLGAMQPYQSDEFILRSRYLPNDAVIRSATVDAAKVLRKEGEIGVIAPGAHADFIVVDGDPLKDITVLTEQGKYMPLIVQEGVVKKSTKRF